MRKFALTRRFCSSLYSYNTIFWKPATFLKPATRDPRPATRDPRPATIRETLVRKGLKYSSLLLEVKKGGFSTSWAVQPQKVHSSSLCDTCQGITPKICDSVFLQNWCLSGVKKFYATPTNQDREWSTLVTARLPVARLTILGLVYTSRYSRI